MRREPEFILNLLGREPQPLDEWTVYPDQGARFGTQQMFADIHHSRGGGIILKQDGTWYAYDDYQ